MHSFILNSLQIETPLGPMLALADEKSLYLLDFIDRKGLEGAVEKLSIKTKAFIQPGRTAPLSSIEKELKAYFTGELKEFITPIQLIGTPFQQQAWEELMQIPYGETQSYAAQAERLGKPSAYRAVANANGANRLSLVVPCHRVINHNGKLGGYGGGLPRKKWLLEHEKQS